MSDRIRPPVHVKRRLRQEANFGCVICGAPIIDYHHIIPYSEKEHNDPEHMVVLCPNHHRHAGPGTEALTQEQLYEAKESPHNESTVDYDFKFQSEEPRIIFGGNQFVMDYLNRMSILTVNGKSLLSVVYINGMLRFYSTLYNEEGELVAEISDNEWVAYTETIWDLDYRQNRMKLWHEQQNIGFEVEYDSEEDLIRIRGKFYYSGDLIRATDSKIILPGGDIHSSNTYVDWDPALNLRQVDGYWQFRWGQWD